MKLVGAEFFLPGRLAGPGIHANQFAGRNSGVDPVAHQDRGTGEGHVLLIAPHFCGGRKDHRLARIVGGGHLEADEAPLARGVHVLLAVNGNELVLPILENLRVDPALGELEAPERLAGAHVHARDISAPVTGVAHPVALDAGIDRHGKGAVIRHRPRGGVPDQFARDLVEGIKPVARRSGRAPVGRHAVHDDHRALQPQRARAAVGKGEAGKLLNEGVLPELLAGGAEGHQAPVRSLQVDVAGFRIDDGRPHRITVVDHIADVIAEAMLPLQLARFRIEADERLLNVAEILRIVVVAKGIELSVGDHRGAPALHLVGPEVVVPAGTAPFLRITGSRQGSRLIRASPVQETGRLGRSREGGGSHHKSSQNGQAGKESKCRHGSFSTQELMRSFP